MLNVVETGTAFKAAEVDSPRPIGTQHIPKIFRHLLGMELRIPKKIFCVVLGEIGRRSTHEVFRCRSLTKRALLGQASIACMASWIAGTSMFAT